MSHRVSLFPLAAAGLTAFAFVTAIFLSADFVSAAGSNAAPDCPCAKSAAAARKPSSVAVAKAPLDETDQIAALETIQFALTQVADGSSYVWHRGHGRLSGIVKPVSSFKDTRGGVCRHAVVVLSATDETKRTEIVACRMASGVWQLEN